MDVIKSLVFTFSSIDRSNLRLEKSSTDMMNLGSLLIASNNFFSMRKFMLEAPPMHAKRVGNPCSRPLTYWCVRRSIVGIKPMHVTNVKNPSDTAPTFSGTRRPITQRRPIPQRSALNVRNVGIPSNTPRTCGAT